MKIVDKTIMADEGKVLRRISDKWIVGKEMTLGITYYINEELLPEPLEELPEHYEEIDDVLVDEDNPVIKAPVDEVIAEQTVELLILDNEEQGGDEQPEPEPVKEIKKVTMGDLFTMQEKLDKIMAMLSPEQLEELSQQ